MLAADTFILNVTDGKMNPWFLDWTEIQNSHQTLVHIRSSSSKNFTHTLSQIESSDFLGDYTLRTLSKKPPTLTENHLTHKFNNTSTLPPIELISLSLCILCIFLAFIHSHKYLLFFVFFRSLSHK